MNQAAVACTYPFLACQEDPIDEQLGGLVSVVKNACLVNPKLAFEIFIHKVRGVHTQARGGTPIFSSVGIVSVPPCTWSMFSQDFA